MFALVVVAAAVLSVYYSAQKPAETTRNFFYADPTVEPQPDENAFFVDEGFTQSVSLDLPAIDVDGKGVLATLNVEAREGEGRIYIDYSGGAPLLQSETQNSFINAVNLAREITGKGTEEVNFYYSLTTKANVVGGSSAGAAAVVATASLLSGKKLKSEFIITGSADKNGNIGKIGMPLEKARAAKKAGYKFILVPRGEGTQDGIDIETAAGIGVIEVDNVIQAFNIMSE